MKIKLVLNDLIGRIDNDLSLINKMIEEQKETFNKMGKDITLENVSEISLPSFEIQHTHLSYSKQVYLMLLDIKNRFIEYSEEGKTIDEVMSVFNSQIADRGEKLKIEFEEEKRDFEWVSRVWKLQTGSSLLKEMVEVLQTLKEPEKEESHEG